MVQGINPRNPAALGALLSGDLENARAASTPGGIVAQEAAGQSALVAASKGTLPVLPKRIQAYPEITREQVTAATGITFGEDVDNVFVYVTLPPGWQIVPTDHNMWTTLLDEQGGQRAAIFYKAAFYDRNAYIAFNSRYTSFIKYNDDVGVRYVYIRDSQRNENIHALGECSTSHEAYDEYNHLLDEATKWLNEHYPDHRNPFAYWE